MLAGPAPGKVEKSKSKKERKGAASCAQEREEKKSEFNTESSPREQSLQKKNKVLAMAFATKTLAKFVAKRNCEENCNEKNFVANLALQNLAVKNFNFRR